MKDEVYSQYSNRPGLRRPSLHMGILSGRLAHPDCQEQHRFKPHISLSEGREHLVLFEEDN